MENSDYYKDRCNACIATDAQECDATYESGACLKYAFPSKKQATAK